MAKRTSIGMAAKIGGCTPEDFFHALAPLGFEAIQVDGKDRLANHSNRKPKPKFLENLSADLFINFDIRAMLADGHDPLKAIRQKTRALKPGEVLLIINNFEPIPLIKLLEKQGFQSYVNFIDPDTIETYFFKTDETQEALEHVDAEHTTTNSTDWDSILSHYQNQLVKIDVRDLEMPLPMMTILENLEILPEDNALFVNHKRIPVILLDELKDRSFDYRIKKVGDSEVDLLIFKSYKEKL